MIPLATRLSLVRGMRSPGQQARHSANLKRPVVPLAPVLGFVCFLPSSVVQAKGNNRGAAVVEFFGAHEFALLKPDALRPLMSLDKCPNKSVRRNLLILRAMVDCSPFLYPNVLGSVLGNYRDCFLGEKRIHGRIRFKGLV